MWHESENTYNIRTLFQKNKCPICGRKLKRFQKKFPFTDEEKARRWKKYHYVLSKISEPKINGYYSYTYYKCLNCAYENTAENQLLIRKIQIKRGMDILSHDDLIQLLLRSDNEN